MPEIEHDTNVPPPAAPLECGCTQDRKCPEHEAR